MRETIADYFKVVTYISFTSISDTTRYLCKDWREWTTGSDADRGYHDLPPVPGLFYNSAGERGGRMKDGLVYFNRARLKVRVLTLGLRNTKQESKIRVNHTKNRI